MDLGTSSVDLNSGSGSGSGGGAEVIDLDALLGSNDGGSNYGGGINLIQIQWQYKLGNDNIFSLDNNTTTFGNTAQASAPSTTDGSTITKC